MVYFYIKTLDSATQDQKKAVRIGLAAKDDQIKFTER